MDIMAKLRGMSDGLPFIKQAREAERLSEAQTDMPMQPGGQQDALRHALWNARMAQDYGKYPAMAASGAHELIGMGVNLFEKDPREKQRVKDETVMDWKNNVTGAQFGVDNSKLTPDALVAALRRAPLEALPPRGRY